MEDKFEKPKRRLRKDHTDETLRETISHGSEEYPFRYYYEDIWLFDLHCIDWHWHPEVEFVLVENGTADFLWAAADMCLTQGKQFSSTHR